MKISVFLLKSILVIHLLNSCKETPTSVLNLNKHQVLTDSIENFVGHKMEELKIPSVSIAIINDGKVAYHLVKGYSDVENEIQVNEQTVFEGASLSKPMFAYMTLLLVDEGRLDLDKPLYQYLNEDYSLIDKNDERYKLITARMVLSHSTGFPNWSESDHLEIQFDPGSGFDYSGEGYRFLEKVLETILQTNNLGLEDFFQQRIAKPLSMNRTSFIPNDSIQFHKASAYENGKKLPLDRWGEFNSASSIRSESIDFSKWLITLLEGKGLSKKIYEELFKEQNQVPENSVFRQFRTTAWTLGLAKHGNMGDFPIYGHMGNNMGYTSLFFISPDKKWGLVLFTNAHFANQFGFDLFDFINANN